MDNSGTAGTIRSVPAKLTAANGSHSTSAAAADRPAESGAAMHTDAIRQQLATKRQKEQAQQDAIRRQYEAEAAIGRVLKAIGTDRLTEAFSVAREVLIRLQWHPHITAKLWHNEDPARKQALDIIDAAMKEPKTLRPILKRIEGQEQEVRQAVWDALRELLSDYIAAGPPQGQMPATTATLDVLRLRHQHATAKEETGRIEAEIASAQKRTLAADPVIVSFGRTENGDWISNRTYQIGSAAPVTVEDNEDTVLQSFLDQPSMTGPQLVDAAGFARAPRVLLQLCRKYPAFASAIRLPGTKGHGGYHVAIRRNPS